MVIALGFFVVLLIWCSDFGAVLLCGGVCRIWCFGLLFLV